MRVQHDSLGLALLGSAVADAIGTGIEMRSREYLVQNVGTVFSGFQTRDFPYNVGHKPGMYSDDYEMTLAVLAALKKCGGKLSVETLYEEFNEYYW